MLNSCATIINGKSQKIYIYTKKPTIVTVADQNDKPDSAGTKHELIVARGTSPKEQIEIDIKSDSLSKKLVLESKTSPIFYSNYVLLIPPFTPIGASSLLIDMWTKRGIYSYPKYNYIDLSESDSTLYLKRDTSFMLEKKNAISVSYDAFNFNFLSFSYERFTNSNKQSFQFYGGSAFTTNNSGVFIGIERKHYFKQKINSRRFFSVGIDYYNFYKKETVPLQKSISGPMPDEFKSYLLNMHKVRFLISPKLGRQIVIAKSFLFNWSYGISLCLEGTKHLNKIPQSYFISNRDKSFSFFLSDEDKTKREGDRIYLRGVLNFKIGYMF